MSVGILGITPRLDYKVYIQQMSLIKCGKRPSKTYLKVSYTYTMRILNLI
jgi:hypothetical protein